MPESDVDADPTTRPKRLLVTSVGAITSGITAERLLDEGYCDAIIVGRGFLKNPGLVWAWADELAGYGINGSDLKDKDSMIKDGEGIQIRLANQIRWGFKGRGKKTSDGKEDHEGKDDGKHTCGAKV